MPAAPAPAGSAVHAPALRPSPSGGGQPLRLAAKAPLAEPALRPSVPLVQATEPEPVVVIRSIADLAALADTHRDMAFKVLLKRCVRPVRIDNGRLEISLTADAPKTLIPDLNANLQRWTGRRWVVSVSREEGGPTLAEEEASRRQNAITDAAADPAVAAILARFPGSRIIDVRLPAAAEIPDDDLPAAPGPNVEDDDS